MSKSTTTTTTVDAEDWILDLTMMPADDRKKRTTTQLALATAVQPTSHGVLFLNKCCQVFCGASAGGFGFEEVVHSPSSSEDSELEPKRRRRKKTTRGWQPQKRDEIDVPSTIQARALAAEGASSSTVTTAGVISPLPSPPPVPKRARALSDDLLTPLTGKRTATTTTSSSNSPNWVVMRTPDGLTYIRDASTPRANWEKYARRTPHREDTTTTSSKPTEQESLDREEIPNFQGPRFPGRGGRNHHPRRLHQKWYSGTTAIVVVCCLATVAFHVFLIWVYRAPMVVVPQQQPLWGGHKGSLRIPKRKKTLPPAAVGRTTRKTNLRSAESIGGQHQTAKWRNANASCVNAASTDAPVPFDYSQLVRAPNLSLVRAAAGAPEKLPRKRRGGGAERLVNHLRVAIEEAIHLPWLPWRQGRKDTRT